MKKYKPTTKAELKELVNDESIYLGDIDTSLITDMSGLFYESNRKDFSGINEWDTSNVISMRWMFLACYGFNQELSFNICNVVDMEGMFGGCIRFNQVLSFDTKNVVNMNAMFTECSSFNQFIDFDTKNVKDMSEMFKDCISF